jgi:putative ABC transport system permease protein
MNPMVTMLTRSLRSLVRRPLYNGLLLVLLSLGLAAFGTVFVLVNATALRPLPFRDAERLVWLNTLEPTGQNATTQFALSPVQYLRWREAGALFDRVEVNTPTTPKLTGIGEPESLRGVAVSGGMMDLIGGRAALGRIILADDDVPGSDVVVLSHAYWMRRFGGDSAVLGSRLTIDDAPRTVIGVMEPSFTLLYREADVFTPVALTPEQKANAGARFLVGIARLRPGVSATQALEQLQANSAELAKEFPVYKSTQVQVRPLRTALLGQQRTAALLIFAAVMLLLLIAGANALNLAFADAIGRRIGTVTRLALGAPARDLISQRLGETMIVGLVAGGVAVLLGRATLAVLRSVNPGAFAGIGTVEFDLTASLVTILAALALSVAVAIPVALSEARGNVAELAGTLVRAVGNRVDRRRRSYLLTAQVAVTLVLLVGTAFLLRNVRSLLASSPGFEAVPVLVLPMTVSSQTYPTPPERANHVARILDAVRAVPGVASASTTQQRFVLAETMNSGFELQEFPAANGEARLAGIRHVTPELPRTMGMRVLTGRPIAADDRIDGPPVAMVSESFARAYMPGEDPVGKHIKRTSKGAPWMEIVGVVNDVKDAGLGYEAGPAFYVSYLQQNTPTARVILLVRAEGDPAALTRAVREAVWSVDPNQTIESASRLEQLLATSAARPRLQALVTGFFAGVALLLALVGIYVITLHDVMRQSREFGVRSALGASAGDLIRLTLRSSLAPVVAGTAFGAAAAIPAVIWVSRGLGTAFTGFTLSDIPVIAGTFLLLIAGTAAVALIAARRVTAIDPAIAMRAG